MYINIRMISQGGIGRTEREKMHGALRQNYRRARTLKMEIDALSVALQEASADETVSEEALQDLKEELDHLRHEFFLTGVSSEYEL